MKMFSAEILEKKIDEQEVEDKLLAEIEQNLEREMTKVKEEQRKEKLREYGILMAQLDAIVYATFNRAFRGEERGSLRRHTNISEVLGKVQQPQQKQGGIFGMFKR